MLPRILRSAFTDDLRGLRAEIEAYADERDLWVVAGEIANSAGNLALHQVGAIKYLVGTVLGGTGYVRDREGEFSRRDVTRAELLREIDEAIEVVRRTLDGLTEAELERDYPVEVAPVTLTVGTFLVRLAMHTSYHNGQVNYHRRLLAARAGQVRAPASGES